MSDHEELFGIGRLAERTGLPVRTIRFWSDEGLIPPAGRSAGGYRLYDAAAQARAELVRTLRDLGLDLRTIRRILDRRTTVADVARAHVTALDAEIRTLRLRRAVLWSVARRGTSNEEMMTVHELARLSARERQQIIDDFVEQAFQGVPDDGPGAQIARSMRQMPADLPDDPSEEQIEAWIELAQLTADPAFRQRVREMALAGAAASSSPGVATSVATGTATDTAAPEGPGGAITEDGRSQVRVAPATVMEHAGGAVKSGVSPDSAAGRQVLDRIVDPAAPAADRRRIADELETFTDRRVERYWQLIGLVNGRPPFDSGTPAFEWLIAALRAHA